MKREQTANIPEKRRAVAGREVAAAPEVRVGVDVGGTFTDICLVNSAGKMQVHKIPSTPADPSVAIISGVRSLLQRTGDKPSAVVFFGHGTTVGTNAVLERRGAVTGVITTSGFR